jgi:hypothetical protein
MLAELFGQRILQTIRKCSFISRMQMAIQCLVWFAFVVLGLNQSASCTQGGTQSELADRIEES